MLEFVHFFYFVSPFDLYNCGVQIRIYCGVWLCPLGRTPFECKNCIAFYQAQAHPWNTEGVPLSSLVVQIVNFFCNSRRKKVFLTHVKLDFGLLSPFRSTSLSHFQKCSLSGRPGHCRYGVDNQFSVWIRTTGGDRPLSMAHVGLVL